MANLPPSSVAWTGALQIGGKIFSDSVITSHGFKFTPPIGDSLTVGQGGKVHNVLPHIIQSGKVNLSIFRPTVTKNQSLIVTSLSSENEDFRAIVADLKKYNMVVVGSMSDARNASLPAVKVVLIPQSSFVFDLGLHAIPDGNYRDLTEEKLYVMFCMEGDASELVTPISRVRTTTALGSNCGKKENTCEVNHNVKNTKNGREEKIYLRKNPRTNETDKIKKHFTFKEIIKYPIELGKQFSRNEINGFIQNMLKERIAKTADKASSIVRLLSCEAVKDLHSNEDYKVTLFKLKIACSCESSNNEISNQFRTKQSCFCRKMKGLKKGSYCFCSAGGLQVQLRNKLHNSNKFCSDNYKLVMTETNHNKLRINGSCKSKKIDSERDGITSVTVASSSAPPCSSSAHTDYSLAPLGYSSVPPLSTPLAPMDSSSAPPGSSTAPSLSSPTALLGSYSVPTDSSSTSLGYSLAPPVYSSVSSLSSPSAPPGYSSAPLVSSPAPPYSSSASPSSSLIASDSSSTCRNPSSSLESHSFIGDRSSFDLSDAKLVRDESSSVLTKCTMNRKTSSVGLSMIENSCDDSSSKIPSPRSEICYSSSKDNNLCKEISTKDYANSSNLKSKNSSRNSSFEQSVAAESCEEYNYYNSLYDFPNNNESKKGDTPMHRELHNEINSTKSTYPKEMNLEKRDSAMCNSNDKLNNHRKFNQVKKKVKHLKDFISKIGGKQINSILSPIIESSPSNNKSVENSKSPEKYNNTRDTSGYFSSDCGRLSRTGRINSNDSEESPVPTSNVGVNKRQNANNGYLMDKFLVDSCSSLQNCSVSDSSAKDQSDSIDPLVHNREQTNLLSGGSIESYGSSIPNSTLERLNMETQEILKQAPVCNDQKCQEFKRKISEICLQTSISYMIEMNKNIQAQRINLENKERKIQEGLMVLSNLAKCNRNPHSVRNDHETSFQQSTNSTLEGTNEHSTSNLENGHFRRNEHREVNMYTDFIPAMRSDLKQYQSLSLEMLEKDSSKLDSLVSSNDLCLSKYASILSPTVAEQSAFKLFLLKHKLSYNSPTSLETSGGYLLVKCSDLPSLVAVNSFTRIVNSFLPRVCSFRSIMDIQTETLIKKFNLGSLVLIHSSALFSRSLEELLHRLESCRSANKKINLVTIGKPSVRKALARLKLNRENEESKELVLLDTNMLLVKEYASKGKLYILEGVPDTYHSLFDLHEATGFLHSDVVLVTNTVDDYPTKSSQVNPIYNINTVEMFLNKILKKESHDHSSQINHNEQNSTNLADGNNFFYPDEDSKSFQMLPITNETSSIREPTISNKSQEHSLLPSLTGMNMSDLQVKNEDWMSPTEFSTKRRCSWQEINTLKRSKVETGIHSKVIPKKPARRSLPNGNICD